METGQSHAPELEDTNGLPLVPGLSRIDFTIRTPKKVEYEIIDLPAAQAKLVKEYAETLVAPAELRWHAEYGRYECASCCYDRSAEPWATDEVRCIDGTLAISDDWDDDSIDLDWLDRCPCECHESGEAMKISDP